jgi:hypothetical protein
MTKQFGCVVRLDRLGLSSSAPSRSASPPSIAGFHIVRDTFVRSQTTAMTYARVRVLRSFTSNTIICWQYRPWSPWLKPWRIMIISDDSLGISVGEISQVVGYCRLAHVLLAELAFDFNSGSGVHKRFVRRHALFGKSRPRLDRGGSEQLRYGARKAGKLVRCYWKQKLRVFRVELELHSRLLRQRTISNAYDAATLACGVLPKHFRFVCIRWAVLRRYLERRFRMHAPPILSRTRRIANVSLHAATRYLRRNGVSNTHRFLKPLMINSVVQQALNRWEDNTRRWLQ